MYYNTYSPFIIICILIDHVTRNSEVLFERILGENQRNALTLYKFLDVYAQLLAEKINSDELRSLLNKVNLSLAQ